LRQTKKGELFWRQRSILSILREVSVRQLSAVSCHLPDRLKNVNANFLSWPSPLFYEGTINTPNGVFFHVVKFCYPSL
jgi:hypothetical protein